jgi:microcystin-dependent protein
VSAIQVVNQGEEAFLDLITDIDMTLRLYRNNVVLGLSTVQIEALTQAAFTEANFAGYAASSMTTSWTTTQGNPSVATRAEVTFTRSSTGTAQLVYGYYLTRNSDGALQWFEHFDGPVSIEFINDAVKVTPTITLDDVKGNAVESGVMTEFAGTVAPTGWHMCDGSAISRTTFASLFATIGTTYGVGDGATTFNLPDRRGRFGLGKATAGTGSVLGQTGGAIDHAHHLDTAGSGAQIMLTTVGNNVRQIRKTLPNYSPTHEVSTALAVVGNSGVSNIGTQLVGDSDVANPPYIALNYIIKD